MPKQFKFTLGTKLIGQATELTHSIFLAYEEAIDKNRKLQLVQFINHHIQSLLLSYRTTKDTSIVHLGQWVFMLSIEFYTYITLMNKPNSLRRLP